MRSTSYVIVYFVQYIFMTTEYQVGHIALYTFVRPLIPLDEFGDLDQFSRSHASIMYNIRMGLVTGVSSVKFISSSANVLTF